MENTQKTTKMTANSKPQSTVLQQFSNVMKRVIFGTVMISGFLVIILLGPLALMATAFAIQVLCFSEILIIGYNNNKIPSSLPYFRSICWYFLMAANYFFSVETIAPHFQDYHKKFYYLRVMITYHRFISFCIYFVGIVLFVLSLVRKYDSKQFRILAWTHTLLIIIVLQSYMIIENIFNGLLWLILPVSLVILNDIFAYMFGRLWGKTPLIKLSPKKTWEGFVGGVIGTLISGFILSNVMCRYKYFVCPIEYYESEDGIKSRTDCTVSYLFESTKYEIGSLISVDFFPFTWHFLALALFASIIAPFGGFCASGFKRAFKIKDFSDVIPGHGGIMDRNPTVDLIFDKILYLDEESQVEFYYMLRNSLETSKILNLTKY